MERAELAATLGVVRHDARSAEPGAIAMSLQARGLFDAVDERRVVIVEHADALSDAAFIADVPEGSALVLVSLERPLPRGRRPPARRRKAAAEDEPPPLVDLPAAVRSAAGRIERIAPLSPDQAADWIAARARIHAVALRPEAVRELASAVGADTERLEQELEKLGAYAAGGPVGRDEVRALVHGAIDADVFQLTRAVVQRRPETALEMLERLLQEGQAPQQILALLLWQFRVLLFASAMRGPDDAERMAKAIRSSPSVIARWQPWARGVTKAEVTRAYEALYATDLAIKQGRTEAETALMLCVMDLCGVPGADVRDLVVGEPPRR